MLPGKLCPIMDPRYISTGQGTAGTHCLGGLGPHVKQVAVQEPTEELKNTWFKGGDFDSYSAGESDGCMASVC
jgi:hypothetical protein